jgi:hypothetical protein
MNSYIDIEDVERRNDRFIEISIIVIVVKNNRRRRRTTT